MTAVKFMRLLRKKYFEKVPIVTNFAFMGITGFFIDYALRDVISIIPQHLYLLS